MGVCILSNNIGEILERLQKSFNMQNITILPREELVKKNCETYNKEKGHLHEIDGYNCGLCNNKGDIHIVIDGSETMRICECMKIRATLKRAKRSGLGDTITEFTFDKYITKEKWQENIKNIAMEFCNDETAKWFFIGGQVGSGKSHLCTAISAHYIKQGVDVRYMMWFEDGKRLKALINDIRYQEEINKFKDVDVLYIDDFLKTKQGEQPTAADINLAFEIINHRLFDKNKITIISSEKLLDDIMDYDEATMSRVYQKTGKYKILIPKDKKKNYRLQPQ